jgi:hypothetical protein
MNAIDLATYRYKTKSTDLLAFKRHTFDHRKDGLSTIEYVVNNKGIKLYDGGVFYGKD